MEPILPQRPAGPILRVPCPACEMQWIYEPPNARWAGEGRVRCVCGEIIRVAETVTVAGERIALVMAIEIDPDAEYVQSRVLGRPMRIGPR